MFTRHNYYPSERFQDSLSDNDKDMLSNYLNSNAAYLEKNLLTQTEAQSIQEDIGCTHEDPKIYSIPTNSRAVADYFSFENGEENENCGIGLWFHACRKCFQWTVE